MKGGLGDRLIWQAMAPKVEETEGPSHFAGGEISAIVFFDVASHGLLTFFVKSACEAQRHC